MTEHDTKKSIYFTNLGLSVREAIRLQKRFGLFEKEMFTGEVKFKRRRHQAPEHMLVVTARAMILGEWLGLSSEIMQDLKLSAAMHDAFKAEEHKITKEGNFTWKSFEIAEAKETEELRKAEVSEELIDLIHAAGHPLNEAQRKIKMQNLFEADWAWLLIFYTDNYTSGVSWANGDSIEERFGKDRVKYIGFDESAIGKIDGHPNERGFDALIRVGKEAQKKIAERLSELKGESVEPAELPVLVDEEITRRIELVKI